MTTEKSNIIPDLLIEDCEYKGYGTGYLGNRKVLVPYTAPGDRVEVAITHKKKSILTGKIARVISPSPHRVKVSCPYFTRCGGCCWQHIELRQQMAQKKKIVQEALLPYVSDNNQENIIQPSPSSWRYRNKMEYAFGYDQDGRLIIGQHYAGNYEDIVSIESCRIQPEVFDRILRQVKEFFHTLQYVPWSPVSHEGFLRQVMIRMGYNTGQVMVSLLTSPGNFPEVASLSEKLFESIPHMTSFYWGTSNLPADIFFMQEIQYQQGEKEIEERIGSKQYRISPHSFFQTNTLAAERLYELVKNYAALTGRESVLDAYCGTGSIGIYLADKVRHLWGIDSIQEAIFRARENARLNNVSNSTFLKGEMRLMIPKLREFLRHKLDVIIIDPPRAGMHKKALKHILQLEAPRLIYVSCNPMTLARDLDKITQYGYKVQNYQVFDFYPHTYHIETCLFLTKTGQVKAYVK